MRLDKAILKAPKLELETQTRNNVIVQFSLSIGGLHWRLGPSFCHSPMHLELALANSIVVALLFYSTMEYKEVKYVWYFLLYIHALRTCLHYQRRSLDKGSASSNPPTIPIL